MKSFDDISRWLHVLVATLVVWSHDRVESLFVKLDAKSYALLGTLTLAVIGMQLSDWLVEAAINKQRWVRRLLSGQNDIEGDWVDIVVDTAEPHTILYAEYCCIRYTDGRYKLSGETWTLAGRWSGDFSTSGGVTYRGRELAYYYKTAVDRVGGFGVIKFSPNDALPTDFVCRYVDKGIRTPHLARGRRLSTKLSKVPMDKRKEAALAFAHGFDEKGLLDFDAAFLRNTMP